MTVNGVNVPVYCTPVYVATGNCGALQSFAMIDVSGDNLNLSVTIKANGFTFSKAVVQPATLGVTPSTSGQTITSTIRDYGNYTYLVCDSNGNASQQHALTLAVRTYVDEDAEIAACGCVTSLLGSVLEWHSRGQRFDLFQVHQNSQIRTLYQLVTGSDFCYI